MSDVKPYEPVRPDALEDIDFLDGALQNCPYHAYEKLREEAPIWQDPITGFFVISRFDDIRDVLLDPKRFVNSMEGGQNSRSSLDNERALRMQNIYEENGNR